MRSNSIRCPLESVSGPADASVVAVAKGALLPHVLEFVRQKLSSGNGIERRRQAAQIDLAAAGERLRSHRVGFLSGGGILVNPNALDQLVDRRISCLSTPRLARGASREGCIVLATDEPGRRWRCFFMRPPPTSVLPR